MTLDPIIEELHQQRAEEMERFHFDFEAYYRYLKKQEKLSGATVVAPPSSSVRQVRMTRRTPDS